MVFGVCPRRHVGRRSSSGEAWRPASPPQEARLPPKARRTLALALDQPVDRCARSNSAAHRDLRSPGSQDLSGTLSARDWPLSLANNRLDPTGAAPAGQPKRYPRQTFEGLSTLDRASAQPIATAGKAGSRNEPERRSEGGSLEAWRGGCGPRGWRL